MSAYVDYRYIYPPRPELKVPRSALWFYEQRGYHAQVKKNGTCTVIFTKGADVIFKTRHDDDHKLWTPLKEHVEFFAGRSDKWNVYVAELLHSKTPHVKNQLYVFDQIVRDGVHLVGTAFAERQHVLHAHWKGTDEGDQVRVHPYVSVAKCYTAGFDKLFESLKPEDEGLVLKDPKGKLVHGFKSDSNARWQVKCRVTHKNYSF